jgi:hypothetical protein
MYGIVVGRLYDGTPVPMAFAIAGAGLAAAGAHWWLRRGREMWPGAAGRGRGGLQAD